MSKIVFPSKGMVRNQDLNLLYAGLYILYKVESVRNKDLNLKELQQLLIIIF